MQTASSQASGLHEEPAPTSDLQLSRRELRRIHLRERAPWLLPVVVVFLWLATLGSFWQEAHVLLQHGGSVGLKTPGDLWHLALHWQKSWRLFEPYEVLVIERVNAGIWQLLLLVLLTGIALLSQRDERLVQKLWRALQERRPD